MKLTAMLALMVGFAAGATACPMSGHEEQTVQSPILILPPVDGDAPTADS